MRIKDKVSFITLALSNKGGGGGGGTDNYNHLSNKPKLNNVEIAGSKTSEDFGLQNMQLEVPLVMLDGTKLTVEDALHALNDEKQNEIGHIYGFHISSTESDPYEKVTYLKDAVGMTPAYMDYTKDEFNYGSWENAFFMPRPCMLKADGTVDYYLDENDFSKKEDGVTASDIENTSYNGNAMMEWGRDGKKIWWKVIPDADGNGGSIFIADYQADQKYVDYNFRDCNGNSADHFYTPIYNGSVIDGRMRSLSGQAVFNNHTAAQEITAAKENNPTSDEMWNIENYCDRMLINFLLVLLGKSTNTQAVFGLGAVNGGSEAINNAFRTGVHNNKGLFYGKNRGSISTSDYSSVVKVFGMENYWGFQWTRINGLICRLGNMTTKLTYSQVDGSTADGYNTTADNYISVGAVTATSYVNDYQHLMKFIEKGIFPISPENGTETTDYCDSMSSYSGTTILSRICSSISLVATALVFSRSLSASVDLP